MQRLDTRRARFYIAPPLSAAVVAVGLVLGLFPGLASAENVGGVQLPDGVQKVGENRYRAPEDFDKTMRYYRTVYPPGSYPRKSIVNQPGVKAVHIANPSGKRFGGLNIYEANDEVRIYIVPVEPKPVPQKKKPESKPAAAPKPNTQSQ